MATAAVSTSSIGMVASPPCRKACAGCWSGWPRRRRPAMRNTLLMLATRLSGDSSRFRMPLRAGIRARGLGSVPTAYSCALFVAHLRREQIASNTGADNQPPRRQRRRRREHVEAVERLERDKIRRAVEQRLNCDSNDAAGERRPEAMMDPGAECEMEPRRAI